ncbi:XRE family transcriptional regulator [Tistrella mobilis]|uniref:XRE family transcriptional regulator n=1 Tax=Tistrella mobilis TaxID=171437 RepID=UPI003556DEE2
MARTDEPEGIDNVLIDLGFEDAGDLSAKAVLALRLNQLIDQHGLSQVEVAAIIGVSLPKISQLRRYKLQTMTLQWLTQALSHVDG